LNTSRVIDYYLISEIPINAKCALSIVLSCTLRTLRVARRLL